MKGEGVALVAAPAALRAAALAQLARARLPNPVVAGLGAARRALGSGVVGVLGAGVRRAGIVGAVAALRDGTARLEAVGSWAARRGRVFGVVFLGRFRFFRSCFGLCFWVVFMGRFFASCLELYKYTPLNNV